MRLFVLGIVFLAPLGNQVCGLVVQMSTIPDFENVVGFVDGFTRCHIGVFLVCCSASFRGTSHS